MTQTSAFHFESLVWDWPIAIYLFLIGISAGLVTLAVLLRRVYPQAGGADSTLLRTTLIVGPGAVILGLLILVFHLTRPWTFWKLMFHYSFTSVMSMGVMLFQLYMVVLVLWLAKIFEHDLLALQQRWLPKLGIVQKVLSLLTPVHRGLETLMLVLAVLLGAYTGFLLSALKSYPFLNNPILPVLFLFSGISSGAAVALIAMAIRQRSNPHSTEAHFVHRMEIPVVWGEIFLLVAFFVGLALGDDGKVRALVAALGGGFWTWWFWLGVAGLGIVQKVLSLLTPVHRGLETLMLVLAVLLGAYTGFLLSALKSYPFLNNPILPVLFLFSGISSGAAVALIAMAIRQRNNPHSTEAHFVHRMEIPVVWGEIFLLVAFFVGLALGDDGKVRALVAALGGGFWTWWFWLGVAGLGLIVPMLLKPWVNRSSGIPAVLAACGASLVGVLMLRFFILYAGQLTVA